MESQACHREWVIRTLVEHEARLRRYLTRLFGDEHTARDVVQQVFLSLCDSVTFQRLPAAVIADPGAWLFTLSRNRALDVLRMNGRCVQFEEEQGSQFVCGRIPEPAAAAEHHDMKHVLSSLLDELPAAQREVLILWGEGFSYREIGEIAQLKEGHVRVIAHRALARLRTHPTIVACLNDEKPTCANSGRTHE